MIQRLYKFINVQNISVRAFEHKISASDGMIRRAINNKTDIQSKWIKLIADNYPNLNLEWLITGEGNMLKDDSNNTIDEAPLHNETKEINNEIKEDNSTITLLNALLKEKEARLQDKDKIISGLERDKILLESYLKDKDKRVVDLESDKILLESYLKDKDKRVVGLESDKILLESKLEKILKKYSIKEPKQDVSDLEHGIQNELR